MFKMVNFILFLELHTHSEFNACNTLQKGWDGVIADSEPWEMLKNTQLFMLFYEFSMPNIALATSRCLAKEEVSIVMDGELKVVPTGEPVDWSLEDRVVLASVKMMVMSCGGTCSMTWWSWSKEASFTSSSITSASYMGNNDCHIAVLMGKVGKER